nr:hypothetical protein [Deltaproteobacteria bacterium]
AQDVTNNKKFSLTAGKHTVRVSNAELGYKPITRAIMVEANRSSVLKVDLETGRVKEPS